MNRMNLKTITMKVSEDTEGLPWLVGALDRKSLLLRPEYCDSDSCPDDERQRILNYIDWLNGGLGSYGIWSASMAADLAPVGGPAGPGARPGGGARGLCAGPESAPRGRPAG